MYKTKIRKSTNRDCILECMFRNAPISRKEIVELTAITPATVTMTMAALLEEGLVQELGEVEEDQGMIGRKRIALQINPNCACAAGIEFNQTAVCAVVTDLSGRVLASRSLPYAPPVSQDITKVLVETLRACLSDADCAAESLLGIGVAVPGHIDQQHKRLISNHKLWQSFDGAALQAAFAPLPVVFENNARCMALAEYLFRPKKTPSNFAFFHVGLGMFCANVIDDELFLGNAYVSGEIGHTIVDPNGQRCECGKHGCLQTIASERSLLEHARVVYELDENTLLRAYAPDRDSITIENIAAAYAMGDTAIRRLVAQALKYLSISTSNIAILMNPEKIFLHGRLFNYAEIRAELTEQIDRQLEFVEKTHVDTVEILPYDPLDGAVGGSALAILRCLLHTG